MHIKLGFGISWHCSDKQDEVDPRLLQLLRLINQYGSLQKAASAAGLSYRTAWEILGHWGKRFQSPLCQKNRGRGTRLTELGEKLVLAKQQLDAEFANALNISADTLNSELEALLGAGSRKDKLIAYTSDDLAVQELKLQCEKSSELSVEFIARGSLEALKQLQTAENVIAGFHFPEGSIAIAVGADYRALLDDSRFTYIRLAQRQQGLMFRSSHQNHIKRIVDLKRRSLTFINRQKGSGTRTIFDHLLRMNHLDPRSINGYKREEFTHTAVAAMVSSHHADAGFGLKAAAVEFNLQFLPLLEESYIIAYHKSLSAVAQNEIRRLLKHDKLKKQIGKLPGYSAEGMGKPIHASKLLLGE